MQSTFLPILCCSLLFGGCYAQFPTAGGCPSPGPFNCPFNSDATCDRDGECPGKQLCCGCPRECKDPRGPALPQVGNCPIVFEIPLSECARRGTPNTCSNDNQCSNGQSCCPGECGGRSCKSPTGGGDFPDFNPGFPNNPPSYSPISQCPVVDDVDCRARFPAFQCSSDNDCDSNKSCCPSECGGRVCARLRRTPPAVHTTRLPPRRPGRVQKYNKSCPIKVPRRLPALCARVSVLSDCFSNRDCGRKEMCCPSSQCGGGRCVAKRTRTRKRCPAVPARKPAFCSRVRVGRLCNRNGDCAGKKRCCPGTCGGASCV